MPRPRRPTRHVTDFAAGLAAASLKGVRFGVLRKQAGSAPGVATLFDAALADLAKAGAVLVEIDYDPPSRMGEDELTVLLFELREDLGAYLAASPAPTPGTQSRRAIAFNNAHPAPRCAGSGRSCSSRPPGRPTAPRISRRRASSVKLAGAQGIDKLLEGQRGPIPHRSDQRPRVDPAIW